MGVVTFEGIVDHGQIRLKTNIRLPEKTKVYVVVPDIQIEQVAHVFSPRLAHPEQAADFKMEIVEEPSDTSQRRRQQDPHPSSRSERQEG